MKKSLFRNQTPEKPTLLGALARMGDTSGLRLAGGSTMNLSTPIGASVQDGPRMTTTHFGGKKAAPFVKGGGRSKTHPNDAKGRKRAAAKAALAARAAKGADLSNIDLAMIAMKMADSHFDPNEPRDLMGRWVKRVGSVKTVKDIGKARADLHSDMNAGDVPYRVYSKLDGQLLDKLDALHETKVGTAKSLIHHGLAKEPLHDKVVAHFGEKASAKDRAKFEGKNGGLGAQSTEEAQYLKAKNSLAKARLSKDKGATDQALRDLDQAAKAFHARHPSRAKSKYGFGKKQPQTTDSKFKHAPESNGTYITKKLLASTPKRRG